MNSRTWRIKKKLSIYAQDMQFGYVAVADKNEQMWVAVLGNEIEI